MSVARGDVEHEHAKGAPLRILRRSSGLLLGACLCVACTGPEDFRLYPRRPNAFAATAKIQASHCGKAVYYYWVAPTETAVGSGVELGTASLADSAVLSIEWATTQGNILDPGAETTRYVCTTPGRHDVTLTLTDEMGCEQVESTDVTCVERKAPGAAPDGVGADAESPVAPPAAMSPDAGF